jgi:hypothetical protein
MYLCRYNMLVSPGMVGLYKLNPNLTHELESAWFQPLSLSKSDFLVSKACFHIQLVPLRRDAVSGAEAAAVM